MEQDLTAVSINKDTVGSVDIDLLRGHILGRLKDVSVANVGEECGTETEKIRK